MTEKSLMFVELKEMEWNATSILSVSFFDPSDLSESFSRIPFPSVLRVYLQHMF